MSRKSNQHGSKKPSLADVHPGELEAYTASVVRKVLEEQAKGTALAVTDSKLPVEVKPEHVKLRPGLKFLDTVLKIPGSTFAKDIENGVLAGTIKTGVMAVTGLALSMLRPHDPGANAIETAAVGGFLASPVTKLVINGISYAAGKGREQIQKYADNHAANGDAKFAEVATPKAAKELAAPAASAIATKSEHAFLAPPASDTGFAPKRDGLEMPKGETAHVAAERPAAVKPKHIALRKPGQ